MGDMQYQEVIDYLFHVTPVFEHVGAAAYKPGLETTVALDEHYGQPHRSFQCIHVAGTNGKGSVSHSLASILQTAGMRVGLYTSPHLVDFRERVRVNGIPMSEQYVVDFTEDFIAWNQKREKPLSPSFFELTTAMAFRYFADQHVDTAVVEVGLGGRLDCTNIITPILSIITNIAFDHTQMLGNTLALIAGEKAGIIKKNVPVIIGETTKETKPVFEAKANDMDAPILFAEEQDSLSALPDFKLTGFELKGSYQQNNLRTILCAVVQLRSLLPGNMQVKDLDAIVRYGLTHVCETTGLKGRWQTVREKPLVICDTGHNPAAWTYLAPQIKRQPCRTLRIVFGMVDDKDIESIMTMLPRKAVYYFTQADNHRSIPAEQVAALAVRHGLKGDTYKTVGEAYHAALACSHEDDFIFVGGSSYVVADFLSAYEK